MKQFVITNTKGKNVIAFSLWADSYKLTEYGTYNFFLRNEMICSIFKNDFDVKEEELCQK